MKVAYFSPLPPSTSGIADYSMLLLSALSRLVDVEVVRPGRTRPIADADVAVYHIGNDPDAHAWIVDALRRRPGVVVLHDFVIHHLVAGMTIGRNDGHAYLSAMEREGGAAGRMLGWGVLEGRVPPLWEIRPAEFPLAGEVLDLATGVIVHSRYAETLAREHGYDGPLWRIAHPAWPAPEVAPARLDAAPLLGCFGHLNENKRIPQLLRAFAEFRRSRPEAKLLLVGAEAPGFDLAGRLERLGLDPEGVIREPYVEEERLWALIRACDACLFLRAPTMGETSGGAIRALSLGKPLVVSDLGWFSELPDDVAIKVPVGGDEEIAALVAAMERLDEPDVRARMSGAALAYIREEHDLDRVAEGYAAALEQVAGAPAVESKILQAVAEAAAVTGVDASRLAPELAELGLVSPNGRVLVSDTRTGFIRIWPMWAWLGSLYVVAVTVHLALGLRVVSPWIMVDELVYSDMARSFADTGHFLIRGGQANYGFVYPLLLSPAYKLFTRMPDVYEWARAVNALVMCSVVAPVYLLARRVVRPGAALAAAALAVAIPPMIYVGTLMTENAFYPVFAWLAYALVLALERPTLRRQLILLALCAVAFLTRAQAVALVASVLTAPLLLAWIERGRPRRLGVWKPLYGVVGASALLLIAVQAARGKSLSAILGGYSVTTSNGTYHAWPSLRWIVYHVAGLDLSLFVLPFAALIVLVASARHLDRAVRVFSAAAVALVVWLALEVAVFASAWSFRIEERNLFCLAPLFLIALLAWIERGQPRPPRAAVAAAGIAAALPGTIPFLQLMNINAQSDTPFIQPWWYLGDMVVGRANVQLVAVAVAAGLAALFLWLPGRYAPVLPVVVAAGFFATWLPLQLWTSSFERLSAGAFTNGIQVRHGDWIDRTVGTDADVVAIWSGDNPYRIWENEFWNRSIRRVYDLGTQLPGGMPETPVSVRQGTGILADPEGRPVRARYVLADRNTQIDGTPIAADAGRNLTLYRVTGPVRTATQVTGWFADTWTAPHVVWHRLSCARGVLRFNLRSDSGLFPGVTQRITVSGTTPSRVILLPTTESRMILLPLQPQDGACKVVLDVTPSRKPAADPRRLGVHIDYFNYVPTQ